MNLKGRSSLVVSANMSRMTTMRKILENKGMTVLDCTEPSKFTVYYDQNFFQAIILDCILEKKQVLDVLDIIKYNNNNKKMPILLIGENRDKSLMEKWVKHGANDFLIYPYNGVHLIQKVYQFVKDYKGIEVELNSENQLKFNVGFLANLIDFNELHLRASSSVKLRERQKVEIESKFFDENESSHVHLETLQKAQVKSVGTYINTFKILGLNNQGISLLRKLKVRKE